MSKSGKKKSKIIKSWEPLPQYQELKLPLTSLANKTASERDEIIISWKAENEMGRNLQLQN